MNLRFAELVSDDIQIKEKSKHQAILEYIHPDKHSHLPYRRFKWNQECPKQQQQKSRYKWASKEKRPQNRKHDIQFMTLFSGLNLDKIRNSANTITPLLISPKQQTESL
ncbi:Hypothetical_protein [Hexamita inflata]|uniref:Hypothetical_protein n=1 Tax=Hexamita inflata TaxID=28002 RepID=A0ABP1HRB5_9EUKA